MKACRLRSAEALERPLDDGNVAHPAAGAVGFVQAKREPSVGDLFLGHQQHTVVVGDHGEAEEDRAAAVGRRGERVDELREAAIAERAATSDAAGVASPAARAGAAAARAANACACAAAAAAAGRDDGSAAAATGCETSAEIALTATRTGVRRDHDAAVLGAGGLTRCAAAVAAHAVAADEKDRERER